MVHKDVPEVICVVENMASLVSAHRHEPQQASLT